MGRKDADNDLISLLREIYIEKIFEEVSMVKIWRKTLPILVIFLIGLCIISCKGEKPEAPIIYEPSKVISKPGGGFVDLIAPQVVNIGGSIRAAGWAADLQKKAPAKGVVIVSAGKQLPISPKIGLKREDVARVFKDDNLKNSGWESSINTQLLGKGKHKLEFYALRHDGMFVPLLHKGKTYCEVEVVE